MEKDIATVISKIPDSEENMRKAKVLRKYLIEDEKGHIHIKDMEQGYFEKAIPDEALASIARNLFVRWRDEYGIEKSYDLANLYLLVMNYVKLLLVNDTILKEMLKGDFKTNKDLQKLVALSNTLDSSYQKLLRNAGIDLFMDRRSRAQKELKVVDDGESITQILSRKITDG